MASVLPDYLQIRPERLGKGQPVRVRVLGYAAALAQAMAREMADAIAEAQAQKRGATLIVPVGPVDQFPILARLINDERLALGDTVFINMDEYLTDDDRWLPPQHPLSF